ncbi:MAG: hypothetical protein JXJ04_11285, partial [Spirochaetales bacterium]|nr:hypothetical protein [Spirochaetales bacterium]
MGDSSLKFTTSDSFKLAKSDTPTENQTVLKKCGVCKSENTVRIFLKGGGSIIGYWYDEEFKCLDCGK